ncbi:MAG: restriction endonuclease subunit S [Desulfobulbus sp.]|nr:restriction endonuclease subunit S [Desulfobulbus sp.]
MASIHDSERVPVKRSVRKPGPYPYYGASGITDYVHNYLFDGDYVLLAEDGDNLRSRSTPIAFMARGQFWVNNHAHVLKGKNGNNTDFICYALQIADVSSYISGSTRPKITQKDMRKIPLFCPSVETQKSIAHVLGSLDDKIELNRQMNATLEAMAQALFKSWFVDFDPVIDNALAAGNPIPEPFQARAKTRHKSSGQRIWTPDEGARRASTRDGASQPLGDKRKPLPEAIQKQFPNRFVFTEEMGWIPEGWEVKSIGDALELAYGKSLPATKRVNGDIPVYGSGGISGAHDEKLVNGPGIVVGRKGTVGSLYWVERDFFPIDTVFYVIAKINIPLYWIYQSLQLIDIKNMGADSAVPGVNRNAVYASQLVLPVIEILQKYLGQIDSNIAKRNTLTVQNHTLSNLRDTLLPKLLSGQLRIPDAEKLMADAL